jgi:hypothetical protein
MDIVRCTLWWPQALCATTEPRPEEGCEKAGEIIHSYGVVQII